MASKSPSSLLRILSIPFIILCAAGAAQSQTITWTKMTVPATQPTPALHAAHFFTKDSGLVCGVAGSTPTGRLYATADGGTTWAAVTLPGSPAALNDIFFIPGSSFGWVVGDGGYVAATTDRGVNWTQRSVAIVAWITGVDINGVYFKDSVNGWVVGNVSSSGSGPRFARTTDGGQSWSAVAQTNPPANNLHDIRFFDSQKGVVVGTGTPPRGSRTTDGGATWTALDSIGRRGASSLSMYGVDMVPGRATAYAAGGRSFATPYHAEVRRTTDYGATWNATSMSGPSSGYGFPASDVLAVGDSMVLVAGWNANLYRTTDAGTTWTAETVPSTVAASVDFRKFSLSPDNRAFLVGTAGTVLRAELLPNATFSSSSIDFGAYCAGDALADRDIVVGNSGAGAMTTSATLTQPSGGVLFQIVGTPATSVVPHETTTLRIRPVVPPGTPAGIYSGSLRVRTGDENGRGADTLRIIPLTLRVRTQSLGIASVVSRDAGRVRVTGMVEVPLPMPGIVLDTSECSVIVDSVALVIGTDFTLAPVSRQTLAARTGSLSMEIRFLPRALCDRHDTVLVYHNGAGSPLRVPVVGTGVLPTFATAPADTLDLGGVGVGRSSNGSIDLRNDLPGVCHDSSLVGSFKLAGPNAAEFTVAFPTPRYIPAGGRISLPVVGTPAGPGRRIAYAILRSEVYGDLSDTVVLAMEGLEAQFTPIRQEIVFDTTDVGGRRDTSVARFLVNLGTLTVRVDSIVVFGADRGSFLYLSPASPFPVALNEARTLALAFLPTRVGRFEALLAIHTDLGPTPITVRLVGYGAFPAISLQPLQIAFAQTPVNTCTDTLIRRFIHNPSPAPLRIRAGRIVSSTGADPADALAFLLDSPKLPPDLVIEPWDSAEVALRFCPKRSGLHRAELLFETNVPGDPGPAVLLLGNGQSGNAVSIDTIRFAPIRVSTARDSVVRGLIFNRLSGDIHVDSITIGGADALSFALGEPGAPFVLRPARDTSVEIRFNPMRRGDHFGFLNIYTSQGAHTVVLAGRAIYPFLRVAPRSTAELRVRPGRTRRIAIDVVNDGDDSARIESATITGDPAFTNPTSGTFPRRLMPGERLSIDVDFTPSHLCEHPAEVRVRGEGVRGVYAAADTTVMVAGLGVVPLVDSRRREVLFGTRAPASTNDTLLNDFFGAVDFSGALSGCLDSASIDSIAIVGSPDFTLPTPADPRAARTLQPGELLPMGIRFRPSAPGLSTAELRIYREASADSTWTIRLAGAAANLDVLYGPAANMIEIDFGKVHRGWRLDSLFTVTARGADPIPIDAVAADPAGEFQVTPDNVLPFQLAPGVPATMRVALQSPGPLGPRRSVVRLASGASLDSIFVLRATIVDERFRADSVLDFGLHPAGPSVDRSAMLINEPTAELPDPALLASIRISGARIVAGDGTFVVRDAPATVAAAGRDSLLIGFLPAGSPGLRTGAARVYYNDRIEAGATVRDSLDVALRGIVAGAQAGLRVSLGPDRTAAPGDLLRLPIRIEGDPPAADMLAMTISFDRSMLRPLRVVPVVAGLGGSFSGPIIGSSRRGTVDVVMGGVGALLPGTPAELELEVLLADTIESDVRFDTLFVPGHPEVSVSGTGMRVVLDGYCDPSGRLVRFDLGPALGSKQSAGGGPIVIEYALPAVASVRLAIYDESGREVMLLADGAMEPGIYSIPLQTTALPSGRYYCQLIAGRFSRTLTLHVTE